MFLTAEELRELTGYVYRSRQIEWLRNRNWKFEINARQLPKVARSYFESRLGGANSKQTIDLSTPLAKPNFQALSQLRAR